jgi:hypothetical protein
MGYLIISRVNRDGERMYVAWTGDSSRIAREMERWVTAGETLEVLDYVRGDAPRYLTSIYTWRDHFKKQEETHPCSTA